MEKKTWPTFFNAREMGRSLEEISVELIKTESQKITSRWFHSNKDVDLFVWMDESKNVLKQQLTFHGQVLEWNLVEGLKTGVIMEEESADRRSRLGSELIRYDEPLQRATQLQGLELLQFVEALTPQDKATILFNFEKGHSFDTMSVEQILSRFPSYAPAKPSFWQKILVKIKALIGRERK